MINGWFLVDSENIQFSHHDISVILAIHDVTLALPMGWFTIVHLFVTIIIIHFCFRIFYYIQNNLYNICLKRSFISVRE